MSGAWKIGLRGAMVFGGLLLAAIVALVGQFVMGDRAGAKTATAAGGSVIATKTFHMSRPNDKKRLVVRCPGGKSPYGGSMSSSPAPGPDGEGAYPHSYERLGQQGGFHATAVLFDPKRHSTQGRNITLQVVCGRKLGHVTPPHRTKYVKPGQTKKVVAKCPGRRHLIGGGFQRTDFVARGGNYVTESYATSAKTWRVVARAFGRFGGEITAIAYCVRSKRPLLQEVSASTTIAHRTMGGATTPSCPPGRQLVFGGFKSSPSGSVFFADGWFNSNASWSGSAFNRFGPTANLTVYGYCLAL